MNALVGVGGQVGASEKKIPTIIIREAVEIYLTTFFESLYF